MNGRTGHVQECVPISSNENRTKIESENNSIRVGKKNEKRKKHTTERLEDYKIDEDWKTF